MQRVRITLPATLNGLGPATHGLSLALALYVTVEVSLRPDDALVVEAEGEGAGRYGLGLLHPVVLALMRLFQMEERALIGLNIHISNQIPIQGNMGAEAAFWTAGVLAGNNLLGLYYSRQHVLEMAARWSGQPAQVAACIYGGLTATVSEGERLHSRKLPVSPMQFIITEPRVNRPETSPSGHFPERVPYADVTHDIMRIPLVLEALRSGDMRLLALAAEDRLHLPYVSKGLPGFERAAELARAAGALGLLVCETGPQLIALTESHHEDVAHAIEAAYADIGLSARSWIVPVDTQGIVVSAAGSA